MYKLKKSNSVVYPKEVTFKARITQSDCQKPELNFKKFKRKADLLIRKNSDVTVFQLLNPRRLEEIERTSLNVK